MPTLSSARLAALLCLLPLAACDSADSDSAVVGSWTLSRVHTETAIESRTDQTLLVLAEPGQGVVSITGDQTHTLTRARYSAEPSIGQILVLEPESQPLGAFRFTTLILGRSTNDQGVSRSDATFEGVVADGSRTRTYRASLSADVAPFVRDGARLAVPAITLDDGEGRTVTASGALTFPTVQVTAGREAVVPGAQTDTDVSGSITFFADGRYERRLVTSTITTEDGGAWAEVAPGRVSLDTGSASPTIFNVERRGGELHLEEVTKVTASCDDGDCLAFVENEVFAERGSLAAARRSTVFTYRSR